MPSLILAALFFVLIHLGVSGTRLRDRLVATVGANGYMIGFSVASLAGIFWLVHAYQHAPYHETWGMLEGWKPVAIVLMLPAFVLVVVGVLTPNPTGVAQEGRVAEAPRGIVKVTRHPFLIGVAIWAIVHLVGNGDVASLAFFGAFAVVALAGPVSIDGKRARLLGPERWAPFARQTSIVPFAAVLSGRVRLAASDLLTWQLAAGVFAYALMLGGHSHIIGVSPFPT